MYLGDVCSDRARQPRPPASRRKPSWPSWRSADERLPARERELQSRRPTGAALDVEGAAEHPHALGHPDETQPPTLRRLRERALDLEARPVVDDLHVDRAPSRSQTDLDRGRTGVLAHVRERFLDRPEDRDPLSRRERVGIAADLERTGDTGAFGEVVHLAVEDLSERAAQDALRLERVRHLAQVAIEVDQPGGQVVEAPVGLLAVVLEDERIDLLLQEADVCGEREHVLDRSVVEIEPEPHEPALGGRDERSLSRARVLEQMLALDDGAERRGGLGEERV